MRAARCFILLGRAFVVHRLLALLLICWTVRRPKTSNRMVGGAALRGGRFAGIRGIASGSFALHSKVVKKSSISSRTGAMTRR
jgi:hypothetical protein